MLKSRRGCFNDRGACGGGKTCGVGCEWDGPGFLVVSDGDLAHSTGDLI